MLDASDRKKLLSRRMRMLNRVVLGGAALFLPIYIGVTLTGESADKLENITNIFANINNQVSLTVPADGVRYMHFCHGPPEEGHKFGVIDIALQAHLLLAWPAVPRCFQLVDDAGVRYYPLSRSPFFIAHGVELAMEQKRVYEGQLLFEMSAERKHVNLLFDRNQESEEVP